MTPDDVNRAKSDAGRWRATASTGPAQTTAPAPVVAAPPAPAPAVSAAPAAPQPPAPQADKKSDTDDLMNQIPALRKKLGL